ncbi:MAG: hypothetical protein HZB55_08095 [Deltaproteobacteria bacterium]|nr:hypothetical protein [Deltaproteobacteria bacterium]
MKDWRHLRGKSVIVQAAGITYRGTVVELGPANLLLKAASGFREIPWERVQRIDELPEGAGRGLSAPSALRR